MLFVAARSPDPDLAYAAALAIAAAAYDADPELRSTRRRVALFICELASQYARRTGGPADSLPISQHQIAEVTGLVLFSVKRALALLELTRVIRRDPDILRITDWRRLVEVAHYPKERLGFPLPVQDAKSAEAAHEIEPNNHLRTAGGEPAYFE